MQFCISPLPLVRSKLSDTRLVHSDCMMVHIFLLTGDDTTDVSPTQELTVRFTIVWIIVGAVALVVLIVIFSIVFLLGFLYSRKRKGTDAFNNTGMQLYIMGVKACSTV